MSHDVVPPHRRHRSQHLLNPMTPAFAPLPCSQPAPDDGLRSTTNTPPNGEPHRCQHASEQGGQENTFNLSQGRDHEAESVTCRLDRLELQVSIMIQLLEEMNQMLQLTPNPERALVGPVKKDTTSVFACTPVESYEDIPITTGELAVMLKDLREICERQTSRINDLEVRMAQQQSAFDCETIIERFRLFADSQTRLRCEVDSLFEWQRVLNERTNEIFECRTLSGNSCGDNRRVNSERSDGS